MAPMIVAPTLQARSTVQTQFNICSWTRLARHLSAFLASSEVWVWPQQLSGPMKVDEGLVSFSKLPRISIQSIPSPTTDMVPPLPKRTRVFSELILFINLIFLVRSNQLVLCLLLWGEGGRTAGWGATSNCSISSHFHEIQNMLCNCFTIKN